LDAAIRLPPKSHAAYAEYVGGRPAFVFPNFRPVPTVFAEIPGSDHDNVDGDPFRFIGREQAATT